jgi:hypothetical protein
MVVYPDVEFSASALAYAIAQRLARVDGEEGAKK